jgi:multicomponent Na+:H+ antiporter subunit D
VGVYALLRVFTLLFVHRPDYTHTVILTLAGLTMVTGMLGALVQRDFRRVLSFNLVGHIGFMLMGLGLYSVAGLAAGILYLAQDIVVKTCLFLVSGVVERIHGTQALRRLGGLYRAAPGLALLFLVPALSLAGIPPLSGFIAKLGLVQAGLAQGQYLIVTVALVASFLTLFSMAQLWIEAFWKPAPLVDGLPVRPRAALAGRLLVPIAILAAMIVLIGLGAGPMYELALRSAEQLLRPADYIREIMGPAP